MEISTQHYKRCEMVKVSGRIDSYTAPEVRNAFNEITDQGRFKIVFDMSEVEFISSSGIWVLLETQKTCKRWNRGELIFAAVPEKIQSSLELAGLEHYFNRYDNLVDAVASF